MRPAITALVALSLTVFTVAINACAEGSSADDLGGLTRDEQDTQPPPENVELRPSNPGSDHADAGSTPSKNDPPPKQDTNTPPSAADSGTPTAPGDCDPNDVTYYLKFIMAQSPPACPCAAGQCCYLSLGCVAK